MRRIFTILKTIFLSPFRLVFWVLNIIWGWVKDFGRSIAEIFAKDEIEDTPIGETWDKVYQNPREILGHLNALRKHLFRGSIVFLIATGFSFVYAERILEILTLPLGGIQQLEAVDITEPIGTFMRVSLLAGFAISLPYIVLEVWLFLAPGLRRRSRIYGFVTLPLVTLFFIAGIAFTYFVMLGPAIGILVDFLGIPTQVRPASYVPFVTNLMFWIGVAFQFPILIYILAAVGLVRAQNLLKHTRLAISILAIFAAMITPTVDPINMMIVWGPLVVLYFLGLGLALFAEKARGRRLAKNAEENS